MIIDRKNAPSLLDSDFDSVPRPDSAVVSRYGVSDLEIRFQKRAETLSELSVVAIPYSASVIYKDRYIFAAAIECEDLRAMAPLMGIPLKELQTDYGTKGFYGEKRIMLYGNGERESLGPYFGKEEDEEVISFLLSLVLDSFDEIEDPVRLSN